MECCLFSRREVQTLRESVRESPAVRFVVQVYSALNSHNYVRFFKAVRSAPFLPACIMHRYFGQVRFRALLIMLKAYVSNIQVGVITFIIWANMNKDCLINIQMQVGN